MSFTFDVVAENDKTKCMNNRFAMHGLKSIRLATHKIICQTSTRDSKNRVTELSEDVRIKETHTHRPIKEPYRSHRFRLNPPSECNPIDAAFLNTNNESIDIPELISIQGPIQNYQHHINDTVPIERLLSINRFEQYKNILDSCIKFYNFSVSHTMHMYRDKMVHEKPVYIIKSSLCYNQWHVVQSNPFQNHWICDCDQYKNNKGYCKHKLMVVIWENRDNYKVAGADRLMKCIADDFVYNNGSILLITTDLNASRAELYLVLPHLGYPSLVFRNRSNTIHCTSHSGYCQCTAALVKYLFGYDKGTYNRQRQDQAERSNRRQEFKIIESHSHRLIPRPLSMRYQDESESKEYQQYDEFIYNSSVYADIKSLPNVMRSGIARQQYSTLRQYCTQNVGHIVFL